MMTGSSRLRRPKTGSIPRTRAFYLATLGHSPIGYFRTSNWNDANRHVHVGCDLHADFRGKGYALMAYRLFLRFLFDECGMNKVSLEVLEHNQRARRLYQRLGFVLEGIKRQDVWREGRYLDSLLFSMLKSEFVAQDASRRRARNRPRARHPGRVRRCHMRSRAAPFPRAGRCCAGRPAPARP